MRSDQLSPCSGAESDADNQANSLTDPTYVAIPESKMHKEQISNGIIYLGSRPAGKKLTRQYSALVLVAAFTTIAVFSWTILCIITRHPLQTSSYSNDSYWSYHSPTSAQNWYHATRVLESIVALLTIPLTSVVCLKGALTYTQQPKHLANVRQAILLADRGWNSIGQLRKMTNSKKLRNAASRFFLLALILSTTGIIIAPLKQILISQKTIMIPGNDVDHSGIFQITDVDDLFGYGNVLPDSLIGIVRARLSSTNPLTLQPYLWSDPLGTPDYACIEFGCPGQPANSLYSTFGTNANDNAFFSQVPASFNTGFYRQYAPRMNFSVDYEHVDESEFSAQCHNDGGEGGFFAEFSLGAPNDSISFCVPGSLFESRWSRTHDRQDISETMFVRNLASGSYSNYTAKITARTTLGYFELPNYFNNGTAGPLLEKGPDSQQMPSSLRRRSSGWPKREWNSNVGPLHLIAISAFDKSLEKDLNHDNLRIYSRIYPLALPEGSPTTVSGPFQAALDWSTIFVAADSALVQLRYALYMANEAWMIDSIAFLGTREISWKTAVDIIIPSMSTASMILLSALLGLFLLGLAAMTYYGYSTVHWTSSLSSYAMLRLGIAVGERLREKPDGSTDDLANADDLQDIEDLPCWVGDAEPEAEIGRLEFGAETSPRRKRLYANSLERSV